MADGLVEKVALALLCVSEHMVKEVGGEWREATLDDLPHEEKAEYLLEARAAIEAMRDPTDAMIDAGYGVFEEAYDPGHCYSTMIDVALKDRP